MAGDGPEQENEFEFEMGMTLALVRGVLIAPWTPPLMVSF
jgi:hypothetical protein